jgi:hypothetical protein
LDRSGKAADVENTIRVFEGRESWSVENGAEGTLTFETREEAIQAATLLADETRRAVEIRDCDVPTPR